MAATLDALRNEIVTSIWGRRIGLDKDGFVIGQTDYRLPVTNATSDTTGTVIPGYGWTSVDTTTNDTWLLGPPVVGAFKYLYTGSTSTGIRTVTRNAATFAIRSSANSTAVGFIAQGGGLLLTLFGVSSAIYGVVSRPTGFSSACSTELALNVTS